jgi:P-type Ca2+ transporter type 2C
LLKAVAILSAPVALTVVATQFDALQKGLLTQPLTGPQWLICLGLALVAPIVVEVDKALRRASLARAKPRPTYTVTAAVAPLR